eukprot:452212-Prymnesium_polylepis.1
MQITPHVSHGATGTGQMILNRMGQMILNPAQPGNHGFKSVDNLFVKLAHISRRCILVLVCVLPGIRLLKVGNELAITGPKQCLWTRDKADLNAGAHKVDTGRGNGAGPVVVGARARARAHPVRVALVAANHNREAPRRVFLFVAG